MKGIVIFLTLLNVLALGSVAAATQSKTQVYIDNGDDDGLWIKFYLDGVYRGGKIAAPNTTKYFAFYRLKEGPHELKIEWMDPDTCVWEDVTKTINAAGEDITAIISVTPHNINTCKKASQKKRIFSSGTLEFTVINKDDDAQFIMLLIDGKRRSQRTLAKYSSSRFFKIYHMAFGTYNATIRWKEADTGEWFEKSREITVDSRKNNVTFETEEIIYSRKVPKPNSSIEISIKNVDDDDLWVDLIVDSMYMLKQVKSDRKRYFGRFEKLYPGKHTVRLRWLDPDLKRFQEKSFVVYLDRGEELSKTFSTVRNTR